MDRRFLALVERGVIDRSGMVVQPTSIPVITEAAIQRIQDYLMSEQIAGMSALELMQKDFLNAKNSNPIICFKIVGSTVFYFLWPELQGLLAQCVSEEVAKILMEQLKEESPKKPRDLDIQANSRNLRYEHLRNRLKGLIGKEFYCSSAQGQEASPFDNFFICADYAVASSKTVDYVLKGITNQRDYLTDKDKVCLAIDPTSVEQGRLRMNIETRANGLFLQWIIDHAFKLIHISAPEELDYKAAMRVHSSIVNGYLLTDPSCHQVLWSNLLKKHRLDERMAKGWPARILSLIEHTVEGHNRNDPIALVLVALSFELNAPKGFEIHFNELWQQLSKRNKTHVTLLRSNGSLSAEQIKGILEVAALINLGLPLRRDKTQIELRGLLHNGPHLHYRFPGDHRFVSKLSLNDTKRHLDPKTWKLTDSTPLWSLMATCLDVENWEMTAHPSPLEEAALELSNPDELFSYATSYCAFGGFFGLVGIGWLMVLTSAKYGRAEEFLVEVALPSLLAEEAPISDLALSIATAWLCAKAPFSEQTAIREALTSVRSGRGASWALGLVATGRQYYCQLGCRTALKYQGEWNEKELIYLSQAVQGAAIQYYYLLCPLWSFFLENHGSKNALEYFFKSALARLHVNQLSLLERLSWAIKPCGFLHIKQLLIEHELVAPFTNHLLLPAAQLLLLDGFKDPRLISIAYAIALAIDPTFISPEGEECWQRLLNSLALLSDKGSLRSKYLLNLQKICETYISENKALNATQIWLEIIEEDDKITETFSQITEKLCSLLIDFEESSMLAQILRRCNGRLLIAKETQRTLDLAFVIAKADPEIALRIVETISPTGLDKNRWQHLLQRIASFASRFHLNEILEKTYQLLKSSEAPDSVLDYVTLLIIKEAIHKGDWQTSCQLIMTLMERITDLSKTTTLIKGLRKCLLAHLKTDNIATSSTLLSHPSSELLLGTRLWAFYTKKQLAIAKNYQPILLKKRLALKQCFTREEALIYAAALIKEMEPVRLTELIEPLEPHRPEDRKALCSLLSWEASLAIRLENTACKLSDAFQLAVKNKEVDSNLLKAFIKLADTFESTASEKITFYTDLVIALCKPFPKETLLYLTKLQNLLQMTKPTQIGLSVQWLQIARQIASNHTSVNWTWLQTIRPLMFGVYLEQWKTTALSCAQDALEQEHYVVAAEIVSKEQITRASPELSAKIWMKIATSMSTLSRGHKWQSNTEEVHSLWIISRQRVKPEERNPIDLRWLMTLTVFNSKNCLFYLNDYNNCIKSIPQNKKNSVYKHLLKEAISSNQKNIKSFIPSLLCDYLEVDSTATFGYFDYFVGKNNQEMLEILIENQSKILQPQNTFSLLEKPSLLPKKHLAVTLFINLLNSHFDGIKLKPTLLHSAYNWLVSLPQTENSTSRHQLFFQFLQFIPREVLINLHNQTLTSLEASLNDQIPYNDAAAVAKSLMTFSFIDNQLKVLALHHFLKASLSSTSLSIDECGQALFLFYQHLPNLPGSPQTMAAIQLSWGLLIKFLEEESWNHEFAFLYYVGANGIEQHSILKKELNVVDCFCSLFESLNELKLSSGSSEIQIEYMARSLHAVFRHYHLTNISPSPMPERVEKALQLFFGHRLASVEEFEYLYRHHSTHLLLLLENSSLSNQKRIILSEIYRLSRSTCAPLAEVELTQRITSAFNQTPDLKTIKRLFGDLLDSLEQQPELLKYPSIFRIAIRLLHLHCVYDSDVNNTITLFKILLSYFPFVNKSTTPPLRTIPLVLSNFYWNEDRRLALYIMFIEGFNNSYYEHELQNKMLCTLARILLQECSLFYPEHIEYIHYLVLTIPLIHHSISVQEEHFSRIGAQPTIHDIEKILQYPAQIDCRLKRVIFGQRGLNDIGCQVISRERRQLTGFRLSSLHKAWILNEVITQLLTVKTFQAVMYSLVLSGNYIKTAKLNDASIILIYTQVVNHYINIFERNSFDIIKDLPPKNILNIFLNRIQLCETREAFAVVDLILLERLLRYTPSDGNVNDMLNALRDLIKQMCILSIYKEKNQLLLNHLKFLFPLSFRYLLLSLNRNEQFYKIISFVNFIAEIITEIPPSDFPEQHPLSMWFLKIADLSKDIREIVWIMLFKDQFVPICYIMCPDELDSLKKTINMGPPRSIEESLDPLPSIPIDNSETKVYNPTP